MSDISPSLLKFGYESLTKEIPPETVKKIKCVLADCTNLRANVENVPLHPWRKKPEVKPLEDVLKNPKYKFLQTGYDGLKRTVSFDDNSIPLIVGNIPYSSLDTDNLVPAILESVRVLGDHGYHIVSEDQVEKMNPNIERNQKSIEGVERRYIDEVKAELDKLLYSDKVLSTIPYEYRTEERLPDSCVQNGDMIKFSVLVHRK